VKSLPWLLFALVLVCFVCLIWLLTPTVESAREASRRTLCANNLLQIGSAILAYHQANGCFPPAYIADKSGKPMHSWRVLILPHLDQVAAYKTYDLNEPWDSPKNKNILSNIYPWYACPCDHNVNSPGAIQTSYLAVVGSNAAWTGEKPAKLADFGGQASHTIMLVEVTDSGIAWAEPRDLPLDSLDAAKTASAILSSKHGQQKEFFFTYDFTAGVNVAMADGSVRFLRTRNRSAEELRKILQIGGYTDAEIRSDDNYLAAGHPNWPNIAALAVWLLSVSTLLVLAVRSRKKRMTVGG
jgi:prepilin-type processing-associated H-X9-DG protein